MTALFPFVKANGDGAVKKGQWKLDSHGRVFCCCPGCGQIARLNHDITSDGMLSPSLECPTEGCHFHRFAKLLDWNPV